MVDDKYKTDSTNDALIVEMEASIYGLQVLCSYLNSYLV